MKILNHIKSLFNKSNNDNICHNTPFDLYSSSKDVYGDVTYFTCLKLLSESLAKMPLKLYKDNLQTNSLDIIDLLRYRPNPNMSASTFWATVEQNRNHYGNAYILIKSSMHLLNYGGSYNVESLHIMPNSQVNVYLNDNNELIYHYYDSIDSKDYYYSSDSVLHLKTTSSFDGLIGKSVKDILIDTISTNLAGQQYLKHLYESGVTAKLVMTTDIDITHSEQQKLARFLEKFSSGVQNAGKIVSIPAGMRVQPLDVKLTDNQFLELRKFTSLQIASAFGVKPDMLNDYSESNYSSSESQQLSFYVDTLQYILKLYEDEINYKLLSKSERNNGYYLKFNEKVLLRTDSKTQSDIINNYVNNGIYTPNEARSLLDLDNNIHGDKLIVNGNYIPLEFVGTQYGIDDANSKGG